MQAEILISISDVTARIVAAGRGLTGQDLVRARTAASSTAETASCGNDATARCQVIDLYHGGQYKFYKYRRYSDVRLEFLPGVQAAGFGSDPDNFHFPRFAFDCTFVRLYKRGRPVSTPNHLHWNASMPRAGDPVIVAGNPGSTVRQLTVAQLEAQRDLVLPYVLLNISELRGRLIRFGEESAENRRISQRLLYRLENSYKETHGSQLALTDPTALDANRVMEADLKARSGAVSGDFATIAAVAQTQQDLFLPYTVLEVGLTGPTGSALFEYARRLVRAAEERQKPSAERIAAYADSQLPLLEKQTLDVKPVYPALEQLTLEFWLSKARQDLTVDDPDTTLLLGRNSPEMLSTELAQSRLGEVDLRKALWNGGMAAISASRDPMIRYVLRMEPASLALRTAWDKVTGQIIPAAQAIAKTQYFMYGDALYPDATFTLRVSYG